MWKCLFLFLCFSLVFSQTNTDTGNTEADGTNSNEIVDSINQISENINTKINNFIGGNNNRNRGMRSSRLTSESTITSALTSSRLSGLTSSSVTGMGSTSTQTGAIDGLNGNDQDENGGNGMRGMGTGTGTGMGTGMATDTVMGTRRTRQFGPWELLPPADFQNLRDPLSTAAIQIQPLTAYIASLISLMTPETTTSIPQSVNTQLSALSLQFTGVRQIAEGLSEQISGLVGEPVSGQRTDIITASRALPEQIFLLIEEIEDVLGIIENLNNSFTSQLATLRNLLRSVETDAAAVDTIIDSMRRIAVRSRAVSDSEDSQSYGGLSSGTIIGIVLGSVVVVVIIFVVVVVVLSRKPKHEGV